MKDNSEEIQADRLTRTGLRPIWFCTLDDLTYVWYKGFWRSSTPDELLGRQLRDKQGQWVGYEKLKG